MTPAHVARDITNHHKYGGLVQETVDSVSASIEQAAKDGLSFTIAQVEGPYIAILESILRQNGYTLARLSGNLLRIDW